MNRKILFFIFVFSIISQSKLLAQWESLGDDIIPQDHRVWSIKVAPDESIWAISTFDDYPLVDQVPKVHRSADTGITWVNSEIPAAINNTGSDISPIDSMNAFIGLSTSGLFQTIDGGQSWAKVESYLFQAYYVHFFNLNEGWVLGGDNTGSLVMSLTSDGGQTWTNSGNGVGQPSGTSVPINTNDFIAFTFSLNSSYDVHGNTIILGRSAGNYWRSDDKGYNWTNHETPLSAQGLMTSNVAMKDENTFMVAGDILVSNFSGTAAMNYTTTDGGLTWSIEGSSGMTAAATRYIPNSDSVFIMVGHNNFGWGNRGTAISYNYGETWEIIDNTSLITIDFINENTGVGTCCNNIWSTANGQIHKWNFELPTSTIDIVESTLVKIIPNPVSDILIISTNGEFHTSKLSVEVMSINGQRILFEEHPNTSEIIISTRDLPKGVYSLRITDYQKSVVKKFIKK